MSTVTLKDAADRFGVSYDTLRRRVSDGQMPEAIKVDGVTHLPEALLTQISEREGWQILDLRDSAHAIRERADAVIEAIRAEEAAKQLAAVTAEQANTRSQQERADRLDRELTQTRSDLEARMTELERLRHDHSSATERIEAQNERLDDQARTIEAQNEKVEGLVERSVKAEAEAEMLRNSLGWWAKRRLARNEGN